LPLAQSIGFVQADCSALPLAAGSVDVATWRAFSLDVSAGMRTEDVFLCLFHLNFSFVSPYFFVQP
jgi:hypothetical protein